MVSSWRHLSSIARSARAITWTGKRALSSKRILVAVTFKLDKQKGSAELLENFHQILFKSKGKVGRLISPQ